MTEWLKNSPERLNDSPERLKSSPERLKNTPERPQARLLLAHGAGAPMDSEFMQVMAEGLCALGIDVWRFEFPYMAERRQTGKKRPPSPAPRLLDSFREAIGEARNEPPGLPLFIGGKSMGGRIASMLADEVEVEGVVCLGYPFHPPGKPEKTRIEHLFELTRPCLIVQGTRDPLGSQSEVERYALPGRLQWCWLEDGDHDFKPRVKSGYRQVDHWRSAQVAAANFIAAATAGSIE